MTEDLSAFLSAIDTRLLDYLDEDKDLSKEAAARLQRFVIALSEGSMTPALAKQDWPDFYDLSTAFVVAYGTPELQELYDEATFFAEVTVAQPVQFTDADRVFLVQLADELERYRETRDEKERPIGSAGLQS